jgi:hypothetical protein
LPQVAESNARVPAISRHITGRASLEIFFKPLISYNIGKMLPSALQHNQDIPSVID